MAHTVLEIMLANQISAADRKRNLDAREQWDNAAHQNVMNHVNQMIASGRARNFSVMEHFKRRKNLSVNEQNRLDDLENGIYG